MLVFRQILAQFWLDWLFEKVENLKMSLPKANLLFFSRNKSGLGGNNSRVHNIHVKIYSVPLDDNYDMQAALDEFELK